MTTAVAGATVPLVTPSAHPPSTESPPLTTVRPHNRLRHKLQTDGTLVVESAPEDQRTDLRAIVVHLPTAQPRAVLQPAIDAETQYRFDVLSDGHEMPSSQAMSCLVYDIGHANSHSDWEYLGETDSFEVVKGRLQRVYHATEQETARVDWQLPQEGTSNPHFLRINRANAPGQYSLGFESVGGWDWGRESPDMDTVRIDIGKTAFAKAKQGMIRDPSRVYEQSRGSNVVTALHASLARASGYETVAEAPREEQFMAAVRVAQGLPYRLDIEHERLPDYAKHPVESLSNGGDCEDKAILLSALLDHPVLGCDPILVFPPGHMSLAVPRAQIPQELTVVTDHEFEHRGTEYIYIEAVSPHKLGKVPSVIRPFSKDGLIAIYDGSWTQFNPGSILDIQKDAIRDWLP